MEDLQIASLYDYQTDESIFENLETLDSQKEGLEALSGAADVNTNESKVPDLFDTCTKKEDLLSNSACNSTEDKQNEKVNHSHDGANELELEKCDEKVYNNEKLKDICSNKASEQIKAAVSVGNINSEKEDSGNLSEVVPIKQNHGKEKTSNGIEPEKQDQESTGINQSFKIQIQDKLDSCETDCGIKVMESDACDNAISHCLRGENGCNEVEDTSSDKGLKNDAIVNRNSVESLSDNEEMRDGGNGVEVKKLPEADKHAELEGKGSSEPGKSNKVSEDKNVLPTQKEIDSQQAGIEKRNTENENNDEDMDDDYFNPLLLCPEVSMAVDEAPVLQGGNNTSETIASPLPYAESFVTYVDEMTGAEISFNLTREEQELRGRMYGSNNPVEFTKIHCTACNVHLGSALQGQKNRFVHPMLKVIICKDCYHFYTSGEFEKDEDGSELYCRWCGQGGQVICCSKCEFVFCKKCIRNNVGRKKLNEIRDSDEWLCFRCDQSQLSMLRGTCYEFFEYVRRELSRASTLNDPSFMTVDHTRCCGSSSHGKKKSSDVESDVEKKRRRLNSTADPDYDPRFEKDDEAPRVNSPEVHEIGKKVTTILKNALNSGKLNTGQISVNSTTKTKVNDNVSVKNSSGANLASLPNVRVISPTLMVPRSQQRSVAPTPGQVTPQLPPGIRLTSVPRMPQAQSRQSFQPVVNRMRPQLPGVRAAPPSIKHEWFEKTVRAAARVNSNLSYTLTQLNKAQAGADSIEALAVVHNKLQEILSNSINSLIQIRKNLRTEFIAGIKSIKFPPKAADNNDDDVILVGPGPSTIAPPPLLFNETPNSVSLSASKDNFSNTKATTSVESINHPNLVSQDTSSKIDRDLESDDKPKIYLKVRSFSQLQTVPSEYITIPDDPQIEASGATNSSEAMENQDKLQLDNASAKPQFNVNDVEDEEVKKMSSVKVRLVRCDDVDKLAKEQSNSDKV